MEVGEPPSRTPAACWVVYGLSPPEEVPPRYTGPFKVTPATNDVNSLKKAVKAEWDASNPGNVLNMFKLTVKVYKGNVLEMRIRDEAPTAPNLLEKKVTTCVENSMEVKLYFCQSTRNQAKLPRTYFKFDFTM